MEKPFPINLMTPAEVRALGWAAESRDKDGHLASLITHYASDAELMDWVKNRRDHGETVTIWPRTK